MAVVCVQLCTARHVSSKRPCDALCVVLPHQLTGIEQEGLGNEMGKLETGCRRLVWFIHGVLAYARTESSLGRSSVCQAKLNKSKG